MTCGYCYDTADCASADEVCEHGECRVGCQTADDCPIDEPLCDVENAYCVQCLDTQDCPEAEFCHSSG